MLLVGFVLLERHQRLPMLDLSLFRIGAFAGANIVAMLVSLGMFGVFFFVSLYVQNILGYSPTKAGAIFLPMTILIIVVAPIAGQLVRPDRLALADGRRHDDPSASRCCSTSASACTPTSGRCCRRCCSAGSGWR